MLFWLKHSRIHFSVICLLLRPWSEFRFPSTVLSIEDIECEGFCMLWGPEVASVKEGWLICVLVVAGKPSQQKGCQGKRNLQTVGQCVSTTAGLSMWHTWTLSLYGATWNLVWNLVLNPSLYLQKWAEWCWQRCRKQGMKRPVLPLLMVGCGSAVLTTGRGSQGKLLLTLDVDTLSGQWRSHALSFRVRLMSKVWLCHLAGWLWLLPFPAEQLPCP